MPKDKALNRSSAITLILAVLRDSSRHGYEIAREIERRSNQQISYKDGTLYPLLHGMEKDGLITSQWQEREGQKPKRVYELTDDGVKELERQIDLWRDFSSAVENVISREKAFMLALWGKN